MLTGIHFLLTYACTYECDHCFLYCSPRAEGTFTIDLLQQVLDEARKIPTVAWIYFEGGEPFLYYPLLLEGMNRAKSLGYKIGLVTNCYWATSVADAELWLKPLAEIGIDDLSISDDELHHGQSDGDSPAKFAAKAAECLGMSSYSICIEGPVTHTVTNEKGEPVTGGGVLFKGRAVDKLTEGVPTRPPGKFFECRHEELADFSRVHIDPFGNIQVCQGVSIGNCFAQPLSKIVREYRPMDNPICGPLVRGGPDELAREYGLELDGEFVDECHYCFLLRKALKDRFPDVLTPRQVYGLKAK